ncbi:hypothetical protein L209DRAFT_750579 [Thermothelomyces heterothallicus CBS 203.75]
MDFCQPNAEGRTTSANQPGSDVVLWCDGVAVIRCAGDKANRRKAELLLCLCLLSLLLFLPLICRASRLLALVSPLHPRRARFRIVRRCARVRAELGLIWYCRPPLSRSLEEGGGGIGDEKRLCVGACHVAVRRL